MDSGIKSMRLKFYKRSAEKFVSGIDPEVFSASGSRVMFPVACHLRFKARRTRRISNKDTSLLATRSFIYTKHIKRGSLSFFALTIYFIDCVSVFYW